LRIVELLAENRHLILEVTDSPGELDRVSNAARLVFEIVECAVEIREGAALAGSSITPARRRQMHGWHVGLTGAGAFIGTWRLVHGST
jgi:hypothetical protein